MSRQQDTQSHHTDEEAEQRYAAASFTQLSLHRRNLAKGGRRSQRSFYSLASAQP
jgi:hypothetical protein